MKKKLRGILKDACDHIPEVENYMGETVRDMVEYIRTQYPHLTTKEWGYLQDNWDELLGDLA